jgi:acyl dehydratase
VTKTVRAQGSPGPVAVGDELPPFTRRTGFENWNRYAAVNDEFVPIHMDDEAGRAAGHPGAIGMGNLQWSYVHSLLRGWLGTPGRVVRIEGQFRGRNTKDMTVTARGVVTAVERDETGARTATLDVWTEDEHGTKLMPAKAVVRLE